MGIVKRRVNLFLCFICRPDAKRPGDVAVNFYFNLAVKAFKFYFVGRAEIGRYHADA